MQMYQSNHIFPFGLDICGSTVKKNTDTLKHLSCCFWYVTGSVFLATEDFHSKMLHIHFWKTWGK